MRKVLVFGLPSKAGSHEGGPNPIRSVGWSHPAFVGMPVWNVSRPLPDGLYYHAPEKRTKTRCKKIRTMNQRRARHFVFSYLGRGRCCHCHWLQTVRGHLLGGRGDFRELTCGVGDFCRANIIADGEQVHISSRSIGKSSNGTFCALRSDWLLITLNMRRLFRVLKPCSRKRGFAHFWTIDKDLQITPRSIGSIASP